MALAWLFTIGVMSRCENPFEIIAYVSSKFGTDF